MTDQMINGDEFSIVNGGSSINKELDDIHIDTQLTSFQPEEIMQIQEVMFKDKALKELESDRKKKLNVSLDESLLSYQLNDVGSGDTYCPLCTETFSCIMNQKKICLFCEKGFCGKCLYKFYKNSIQICQVCFLKCIIDGKSGYWFDSQSKINGRLRRSASVFVMNSIRRIKPKFTTHHNSERRSLQQPPETNEPGNPDHQPTIPRRSYREDHHVPRKIADVVDASVDRSDRNSLDREISNTLAPVVKDVRDELTKPQKNIHTNLGTMTSISSSTMSVYSDIEDSYKSGIPVSGDIFFSTFYDEVKKVLNIYVDQCRNIAVADRKRRRTDPYIKTYLLPDRTKMGKRKSTIKKMSQNPVFKETLSYNINGDDLRSRTLSIAVWHRSTLLKYNIFLGEVLIAFANANLTTKECSWYTLNEKKRFPMGSAGLLTKGELIIKMKYKQSNMKDGKGTLYVVVDGARNLEHDRDNVNAFVKGYLLPDKNSKSKKKTGICKGTLNPTWNSPMIFPDVTLNELQDRSLELSIYHQNLLIGNEFLGGVRLNLGLGLHSREHVQWMDAQGAEKEAWERLLSNPQEYTEETLPLRPNLDF